MKTFIFPPWRIRFEITGWDFLEFCSRVGRLGEFIDYQLTPAPSSAGEHASGDNGGM